MAKRQTPPAHAKRPVAHTSKPAPKRAAAGTAATAVKQELRNAMTTRLLIICFTLLCMIFADLAFWRYT